MTPESRTSAAGRLLVAGFCWLTAAYACVASSTLGILSGEVLPWRTSAKAVGSKPERARDTWSAR